MGEEKESMCLNCLYGSQLYCYYPIVCVHGKRSKDMYHDVYKCKHFEPCPETPETPLCSDETDGKIIRLPIPKDTNQD